MARVRCDGSGDAELSGTFWRDRTPYAPLDLVARQRNRVATRAEFIRSVATTSTGHSEESASNAAVRVVASEGAVCR